MLHPRNVSQRVALLACGFALAMAGCASSTSGADVAQPVDVGDQTIIGEIPTVDAESGNAVPTAPSVNDTTQADESTTTVDTSTADSTSVEPTAVPAEATAVPADPTAVPAEATAVPADATAVPTEVQSTPTAVATPVPSATPVPTATAAPEPTATATPPPTATATPPPTPEPTATTSPINSRATPDGDSLESPQIIELDEPQTLVGELSVGLDDRDYFEFVSPPGQELVSVSWVLECETLEFDNASRLSATAARDVGNVEFGQCTQSGERFGWTSTVDGSYRMLVALTPRAGSFNANIDPSSYELDSGFVPFARYVLAIQPVFAEEVVEYDIAPDDGDSSGNPTSGPPLSTNQVSAPLGDNEDWFKFTGLTFFENVGIPPTSEPFEVSLQCLLDFSGTNATLVSRLLDDQGQVVAQLGCSAGGSSAGQTVVFDPEATYFLQIEMQGVGGTSYLWGPIN